MWKVTIPLHVVSLRPDAVYDHREWQNHVDKHYRLDAVTHLIPFPQKVRIHDKTLLLEADKTEYPNAAMLKTRLVHNSLKPVDHPFWMMQSDNKPIVMVQVSETLITVDAATF